MADSIATPRLNRASLARLRPPALSPRYDPSQVTPGIVHLGLGNFHRAHMARYTHDLMGAQPEALGWGIVGAGLLPGDRAMHDALVPQDHLYTLVERSFAEETASVIGALAGVEFAGASSAGLMGRIADPRIRIVSLTVTENGYCLDRATKTLDPLHPLIHADLAKPDEPSSAIGVIVAACRHRRAAGAPAFTALSCDNIQHNGDVLRKAVLALAEMQDTALASWIAAEVSFPNTMVDRITPVTAAAEPAALAARYGIEDQWPVIAETFKQWVIEDRFAAGRPAWQAVGAQFVADVAPYEFMKLRLLNGSHLAVSGMGRLAGYVTVDEAMADPLVTRYMAALMDRETGPTLLPVPGIDLPGYKAKLIERFANPAIKDTVERVNSDAPLNVLLDPIRDRSGRTSPSTYCAGPRGLDAAGPRRGRGWQPDRDPPPARGVAAGAGRCRRADPRPLFGLQSLFGDLGSDARLVGTVGRWLASGPAHERQGPAPGFQRLGLRRGPGAEPLAFLQPPGPPRGAGVIPPSSAASCATSTAPPLSRAPSRCPAATAARHTATDTATLTPARPAAPARSRSSVCRLNEENVVNPPHTPTITNSRSASGAG